MTWIKKKQVPERKGKNILFSKLYLVCSRPNNVKCDLYFTSMYDYNRDKWILLNSIPSYYLENIKGFKEIDFLEGENIEFTQENYDEIIKNKSYLRN